MGRAEGRGERRDGQGMVGKGEAICAMCNGREKWGGKDMSIEINAPLRRGCRRMRETRDGGNADRMMMESKTCGLR